MTTPLVQSDSPVQGTLLGFSASVTFLLVASVSMDVATADVHQIVADAFAVVAFVCGVIGTAIGVSVLALSLISVGMWLTGQY